MPREDTQFKPGNNANPGGRPKGFARLIREQTNNGADLVAYALEVWQNGKERERWEAFQWLSDRGFGKAPSFSPVEDGDPLELGDVERAIDSYLDELASRREAKAASETKARDLGASSQNGATAA